MCQKSYLACTQKVIFNVQQKNVLQFRFDEMSEREDREENDRPKEEGKSSKSGQNKEEKGQEEEEDDGDFGFSAAKIREMKELARKLARQFTEARNKNNEQKVIEESFKANDSTTVQACGSEDSAQDSTKSPTEGCSGQLSNESQKAKSGDTKKSKSKEKAKKKKDKQKKRDHKKKKRKKKTKDACKYNRTYLIINHVLIGTSLSWQVVGENMR